ncbi:MAG: alpha/beta hydrolase [Desulfurivibrionaceae bacterium]|nr:alpha/beta hydrolase [Desulfobulbales bacterium]MDT8334276.1 alpha/beta hydrolase [Desulfurivibrionaceae bacterium]
MKIIILLLLGLIIAVLVIAGQHRMIYYPRSYGGDPPLPAGGQALEYKTGQGRQVAFYLPPAGEHDPVPERLWLMFGGNASLALDWLELINDFPDPGAGFLLVDYPGYGKCRGRAAPATILASAETALVYLAAQLDTEPADLLRRLLVMGHSLGAAAALLYAENHPVKRIVLISPFTSLKEMAASMVGPVLARTLLQNYDNRAALKKILQRRPVPPITIIHGRRDRVVPVEMGRELARISPEINYLEVENGDHNYILITAAEQILRAMLGAEKTDGRGRDDGT